MTISIMVCDDLPEERLNLSQMLRNYENAHDVEFDLETAADGAHLLSMWKPERWDLVFLDIYMPQLDGVETARRLRKLDTRCKIVFATNSREHGMEGYELNVMDYLTKPITQQDVDEAMDWFFRDRAEKHSELLVRTQEGEETIRAADILYIETRGHNCIIHTPSQQITVRRSIDELSAELNAGFFRCHKSFLVSFEHVARIEKNAFRMDNDSSVPISASNLSSSKSALLAWKTGMS